MSETDVVKTIPSVVFSLARESVVSVDRLKEWSLTDKTKVHPIAFITCQFLVDSKWFCFISKTKWFPFSSWKRSDRNRQSGFFVSSEINATRSDPVFHFRVFSKRSTRPFCRKRKIGGNPTTLSKLDMRFITFVVLSCLMEITPSILSNSSILICRSAIRIYNTNKTHHATATRFSRLSFCRSSQQNTSGLWKFQHDADFKTFVVLHESNVVNTMKSTFVV